MDYLVPDEFVELVAMLLHLSGEFIGEGNERRRRGRVTQGINLPLLLLVQCQAQARGHARHRGRRRGRRDPAVVELRHVKKGRRLLREQVDVLLLGRRRRRHGLPGALPPIATRCKKPNQAMSQSVNRTAGARPINRRHQAIRRGGRQTHLRHWQNRPPARARRAAADADAAAAWAGPCPPSPGHLCK